MLGIRQRSETIALMFAGFSVVAFARKPRIDQTSVTTNTSTIVPADVSSERSLLRQRFW